NRNRKSITSTASPRTMIAPMTSDGTSDRRGSGVSATMRITSRTHITSSANSRSASLNNTNALIVLRSDDLCCAAWRQPQDHPDTRRQSRVQVNFVHHVAELGTQRNQAIFRRGTCQPRRVTGNLNAHLRPDAQPVK